MFMVPSSSHSHCESSPGSFDECRLSAGWPAANPQTKPTDLGCESAERLAATIHRHHRHLSKPAVGRFGIERHPYTESCIDQFPCV